MELLAGHFDNATLEEPRPNSHHATCQFHRTGRFPASTTLDVGISPDVRIENLLAIYHLEIMPIFMKFDGKDELVFPLDAVDEGQLTEWVDRKILQFVETYLRLEQAEPYQRENVVTDPVCGMQIAKPLPWPRRSTRGRSTISASRTVGGSSPKTRAAMRRGPIRDPIATRAIPAPGRPSQERQR